MITTNETTPIEVFSGKTLEAEMVKSVLENAGIEAFLQNEIIDSLYPAIAPGATGCTKVMVSNLDLEKAREVVLSLH